MFAAPRARAGGCVRSRRRLRVTADGVDEAIPQRHVARLLESVQGQFCARILVSVGGGESRRLGQRDDRVAVLSRVVRELAGAQLARAPAHVEGVAQHVVLAGNRVEPGPEMHG
jgi:hypothetical protein